MLFFGPFGKILKLHVCVKVYKLDRSKSSVNLLYFRGGLAYDQKPREINDLTNI